MGVGKKTPRKKEGIENTIRREYKRGHLLTTLLLDV